MTEVEELIAVPESTLDLFDELDVPLSFDYGILMYLDENPDSKRMWIWEQAERIFDECHRLLFYGKKASRLAERGRRSFANLHLYTAEYGSYQFLADRGPAISVEDLDSQSLVAIVLNDELGQSLFTQYYKEKHGMTLSQDAEAELRELFWPDGNQKYHHSLDQYLSAILSQKYQKWKTKRMTTGTPTTPIKKTPLSFLPLRV